MSERHFIEGEAIKEDAFRRRFIRRYGGTPRELWFKGLNEHNARILHEWADFSGADFSQAILGADFNSRMQMSRFRITPRTIWDGLGELGSFHWRCSCR